MAIVKFISGWDDEEFPALRYAQYLVSGRIVLIAFGGERRMANGEPVRVRTRVRLVDKQRPTVAEVRIFGEAIADAFPDDEALAALRMPLASAHT